MRYKRVLMPSDVKINLKPLMRLSNGVAEGLRNPTSAGFVRDAIKQWAARYRSFVQLRFARFSKGGGNWKPLASSTIKARRKGKRKGARRAAILRDTSTLFAALDPTFTKRPGQLEKNIPFGVRVGYGGPARHPKGKATIADIASFHQTGGPHLPQREIIVQPDTRTLNAMAEDMARAFRKFTT